MVTRCILIGVMLIACRKSEGTNPGAAPAVAGSNEPKDPPVAAGSNEPKDSPVAAGSNEPKDPPAATGSNESKDKPIAVSDMTEIDKMERAIEPYTEQARRSYPDAKRRYLAGLPTGHRFAVATRLHSPGRMETVFVAVQRIEGDRITGTIASDVRGVTGYKAGDSYTLPESDMVDWVIAHPDGSEEGNVVGKFIETWSSQQHAGSSAQPSPPAVHQGSGQPPVNPR